MTLSGKTAVITGGNSGIGLATAQRFVDEGARVAILGRNRETLQTAKDQLGDDVLALAVDVADLAAIDAAVANIGDTLGKVDILFANAGIAKFAPMQAIDETLFDQTFDVNVKGVFFTVQRFAELMNDGGSVILNTSVSHHKGWPATSVYAASKAAVRSLARTLAAELTPRGIRVNAISPGPIDTPIYARLGMPEEAVTEMAESIRQQTPMQRFGSPEEIASVVHFLSTDASSYMTGVELGVDGGLGQL